MRLRAFLVIIVFFFLLSLSNGATVFGTVFDPSFNPLQKALVVVNTTPEQRLVALNGSYSLEIPVGFYEINASGGNASGSDRVMIVGNGNFRVDILAFQQLEASELENFTELEEVLFPGDVNSTHLTDKTRSDQTQNFELLALALVAAIALALAFTKLRKPVEGVAESKENEATTAASEVQQSLSPDQLTLLNKLLKEFEGRAAQKELRKAMSDWSEAKVSMELTELEDKGFVKKFKKGRGNVVKAVKKP